MGICTTAQLSDRTLAEQLARRLRGARVEQLFACELAPGDDVIAIARARGPGDRAIEMSGAGATLEDALVQLFAALDCSAGTT